MGPVDQQARAVGPDGIPFHVGPARAFHPGQPERIEPRLRDLEGEHRLARAAPAIELAQHEHRPVGLAPDAHPEAVVARHAHRVDAGRRELEVCQGLARDVVR